MRTDLPVRINSSQYSTNNVGSSEPSTLRLQITTDHPATTPGPLDGFSREKPEQEIEQLFRMLLVFLLAHLYTLSLPEKYYQRKTHQ